MLPEICHFSVIITKFGYPAVGGVNLLFSGLCVGFRNDRVGGSFGVGVVLRRHGACGLWETCLRRCAFCTVCVSVAFYKFLTELVDTGCILLNG